MERPDYMSQHLFDLYDVERTATVDFKLLQNYPNPFREVTTISYRIPQAGKVAIKIYNMRGQLINSYNQSHDSGGQYSLNWNASDHAEGLYFFAMEIDGFYNVKKMLVIRE